MLGNKRRKEEKEDDEAGGCTNASLLEVHTLPNQAANGEVGHPLQCFAYPKWANIHRRQIPNAPEGGIEGIIADITNVPVDWYDPHNPTGLLDRALINFYQVTGLNLQMPAAIPRVNTADAPIVFAFPGNPYVLQFQNDNQRDNFLTFARADFQVRFANDAQAAGFSYSVFETVGIIFHSNS